MAGLASVTLVRQWQRISAYGLARDGDAMLFVQIGRSPHGDVGKWMLPGGGIEHGEHPAEAVVREFAEAIGLQVRVDGLLDVGSDHRQLPGGIDFHGIFAVYGVTVVGGQPQPDPDGMVSATRWVPLSELDGLIMVDAVRDIVRNLVK